MPWQPSLITTLDGREVLSDSEQWRATCEAVYVLGIEHRLRGSWLQKIEEKRGAAARTALEDEVRRLEPYYLLAMGTVEDRRDYLAQVEHYEGPMFREALEARVVAIWKERKAASEAAA